MECLQSPSRLLWRTHDSQPNLRRKCLTYTASQQSMAGQSFRIAVYTFGTVHLASAGSSGKMRGAGYVAHCVMATRRARMTPDNQLAKGLYLIASQDLVRNRFGRAVLWKRRRTSRTGSAARDSRFLRPAAGEHWRASGERDPVRLPCAIGRASVLAVVVRIVVAP